MVSGIKLWDTVTSMICENSKMLLKVQKLYMINTVIALPACMAKFTSTGPANWTRKHKNLWNLLIAIWLAQLIW